MSAQHHYRIDYLLHGAYKTLYVRAESMCRADAWHWASVDAGFGVLPKYRSDKPLRLSRPQAEALGITNVEWLDA